VPGGGLQIDQAAAGLHDRGLGQSRLVTALRQASQVAAQQRRQGGIDLGRAGALELPEGPDHLVR
jgi:hypothetical protein